MSVSVTSLVCKRAQQSCVVCTGVQIWLHRSLSNEIRAWAVVSERLSRAACSFPGGQCAVFVAAHCPSEISTTAVKNVLGFS